MSDYDPGNVVPRAWLDAAIAERDLFRDDAIPKAAAIMNELSAERDQLRRLLADVFTALYPPAPTAPEGVVKHTELPALVAAVRVERDRLQATIKGGRNFRARLAGENLRLRAVAVAADALLSEDRTSWSPEHERLAAALADAPALDVSPDIDERDQLRQLVHDLWAAWNDNTIELHALLVDHMAAPDLPALELSPKQQTLLDETIRWVHRWTAEQLGDE